MNIMIADSYQTPVCDIFKELIQAFKAATFFQNIVFKILAISNFYTLILYIHFENVFNLEACVVIHAHLDEQ